MRKIILLLIGITLISCHTPPKNCLCRYSMYKPIDRYNSTIGVYLFSGDFDKVSDFFTKKGDKVKKLTAEDTEPLNKIIQRLNNDIYNEFDKEEIKSMESLREKFKIDCILIAKEEIDILETTQEKFYFVNVTAFNLHNECCTHYRNEYFLNEDTFDSKLLKTIEEDYE